VTSNTNYRKIPIDLYHPDDLVEIDLYLYYQGQFILNKKKGAIWSEKDTEALINFGAEYFYVIFDDPAQYNKFLEKKIRALLESKDAPIQRKAKVVVDASEPILSQIQTSP
jgi:hypothetical protein